SRLIDSAREKYWKDPTLFDVHFDVCLDNPDDDVTGAVYETLILTEMLAYGWEVTAPHLSDGGQFEFRGFRSSGLTYFIIPGLTWAEFSLRNDAPQGERTLD